jgi:hypothetical protein
MQTAAIESFRIDALVELFRAGLLSLLPIMERARLPWTGDGTSDAWDKVQEALYEAIINSCLEHIAAGDDIKPLAPYGYVMAGYDGHSFLSARNLRLAGKSNAFFDLMNGAAPFDTAVFQELGSDLKPSGGRIIRTLAETDFEIGLRSGRLVSYSDTISYRP